jgi:Sigma-70, region 4
VYRLVDYLDGVTYRRAEAWAEHFGLTVRRKKHAQRSRSNAERNRAIVDAWGDGATFNELGKRFGISRQRAHAIVVRTLAEDDAAADAAAGRSERDGAAAILPH